MDDNSFLITIVNRLGAVLACSRQESTHGQWVSDAQKHIAQDQTSNECKLQDSNIHEEPGVEGLLAYIVCLPGISGDSIEMTCKFGTGNLPSNKPNWFTIQFNRLEHLFTTKMTNFDERARPCVVELTVAYATLKFDPVITSLEALRPPVPVSNSEHSVIGAHPHDPEVIWSAGEAGELPDDSAPGGHQISGSFKCVTAAFDKLKDSFRLNLSAPISNFDSLPLKFRGRLGDQDILVSDSEYVHGESVTLSLVAKHVDTPFAWAGDVAWSVTVEASGQVIPLGSTRVEIYAVSSRTSEAVFFETTPVPVRLLRRIVYPATADYISYLAKTLFYDFGFVYESVNGKAHWYLNGYGGRCRLDDWIDHIITPTDSGDRYNCYDMAGMVQTCLPFLLGNPKKLWAYLEPYGFIKETNLIGRGPCNNPLFENKENPKKQVVVRANTSDPPPPRSGFGNHAFIVLPDDSVVDATSGPHVGNEKLSKYLGNAIDDDPALYKKGARLTRAGTAHGVAYYEGVTSIVVGGSHPSEAPASEKAINHMEVAAVSNPPPVSHSNVHLHQIPDSILSALPGSTFGKPHRTHVTHTSSQAHWDIVLDNDAGVRVVLDVCGDHDAAFRAMARHFETYERDPDEVFKAPGEGRTHGQYSLESIVPGYAVIWVCGNVFVCVFSCTLAHITVGNERRAVTDVVADMIDKHLTDETVDPSAWKMPKIESVSTSELLGEAQDEEKKAYLGARFTVTATVSDSSDSVHASVTTGNVYLTETNAKDYKFTFLARSLGEDTITLTFSHPHTLAVVTHKLHVTVIAKD